ncbi:YicC/YloC family endoribonuclease [Muribaculum caecicola]|uniref:YicC family protein n=1 Tax=Muribaculum caecicola TaxID=3038144 RepID=A0AC61S8D7_9BACT|nr:YicC/YloC family endoribonuclease [Muribaculum caecicola]THG55307.1 YicC family protein [Muribaculum caecicola]
MILSMTGFGKATAAIPNKKITVEIKSLNSKQLDMSARVPASFREKELELRNILAERIVRGKVELLIYTESVGIETTVSLNIPLMAAYKEQVEEMARQLGIAWPDDWYSVLLRFPETVKSDVPATMSDEEWQTLRQVTEQAIDQLMQFRQKEGQKLEAFFTERVNRISDLLGQVAPFEKERVAKIRARLEENLAKIDTVSFDKNRLEQELIFYIEKLDINEEKQRLSQHLSYFKETMANGFGQGKKLGFIAQEMGREINTLGSKSNNADMQRLVVRMKDELEQIKEQVLNVM